MILPAPDSQTSAVACTDGGQSDIDIVDQNVLCEESRNPAGNGPCVIAGETMTFPSSVFGIEPTIHKAIDYVRWSPDGTKILAGGAGWSKYGVWDASTGASRPHGNETFLRHPETQCLMNENESTNSAYVVMAISSPPPSLAVAAWLSI